MQLLKSRPWLALDRDICYECGDCASRILSHHLKKSVAAGFIRAIRDEHGNVLPTQGEMNVQFVIL